MDITAYLSNDLVLKELGERVRDHRIARQMTQAEMSERTGVSLSTLMRLENGKGCSLNAFLSVCQALGVTERLNQLLPAYQLRPTDFLDQKPRRKRASKAGWKTAKSGWVWGEDRRKGEER